MTVSATKVQSETLRALLTGLVDYAGLFPPAALDMETSAREYSAHRRGPMAWMLGRFIVDAGRLGELEAAFEARSLSEVATNSWRFSVLLGPSVDSDIEAVEQFNRRHPADTPSGGCIDTLEVKVTSSDAIESVARLRQGYGPPSSPRSEELRRGLAEAPAEADAVSPELVAFQERRRTARTRGVQLPRLETYYEIPATVLATEALGDMLELIKRERGRAKIRTGGLTPESIPSTRSVATFLAACASLDVPFKATAGLHHPLRGLHSLTEGASKAGGSFPEAPNQSTTMHGFVNLFMAGILARASAEHRASSEAVSVDEIEPVLLETDAGAFHFDMQRAGWRHRTVSQTELARHRSNFAIAFGSCSFDEPLEGLRALGWL